MTLKKITRAFVTLSLVAGLIQFIACKNSNSDPSNQEIVKSMLVGSTWAIQSVTVDGADQTSVYPGLTLKFTETTYTTTNGKATWPANGTWEFTSEDATTIKRNDGIEMNVEVTTTSLKLTFNWASTTLGGRTASIMGKNVFTFVRQ